MPYGIFTFTDEQRHKMHCVHKLNADGSQGERIRGGCHDNEQDAIDHKLAITISEAMRGTLKAQKGDLRHMLLVTSNAYRDKEGEIIKQDGLEKVVDSQWIDGEFIGSNPLLAWHGGEPIGEIVWADMEGPFLVELARELPDHGVDLRREETDAPLPTTVKAIWNGLENEEGMEASHYFVFDRAATERDAKGNVYGTIYKIESSVLEEGRAANSLTVGIVL